jgi:hypothetical protein
VLNIVQRKKNKKSPCLEIYFIRGVRKIKEGKRNGWKDRQRDERENCKVGKGKRNARKGEREEDVANRDW